MLTIFSGVCWMIGGNWFFGYGSLKIGGIVNLTDLRGGGYLERSVIC